MAILGYLDFFHCYQTCFVHLSATRIPLRAPAMCVFCDHAPARCGSPPAVSVLCAPDFGPPGAAPPADVTARRISAVIAARPGPVPRGTLPLLRRPLGETRAGEHMPHKQESGTQGADDPPVRLIAAESADLCHRFLACRQSLMSRTQLSSDLQTVLHQIPSEPTT